MINKTWSEESDTITCLVCGTPKDVEVDKTFPFCKRCQEYFAGYLIMACLGCGSSQVLLKTENLSDMLEERIKDGRRVYNIFGDITIALYLCCPTCDPEKKEERARKVKNSLGG